MFIVGQAEKSNLPVATCINRDFAWECDLVGFSAPATCAVRTAIPLTGECAHVGAEFWVGVACVRHGTAVLLCLRRSSS